MFFNIMHKIVQVLSIYWSFQGVKREGGGGVESREPQTRGLSVNSIADPLSLNFVVWFAEMSSYFSMKTNKRKVRKCLNCVKEFSGRFDLANGKYSSIFLGVFARIVKVTHFRQVINFRERAHGKSSQKVRENLRKFFFTATAKQSLLSLLQHSSINKKFIALSFLQPLFFEWAFQLCPCKGCRSDNNCYYNLLFFVV